MTLAANYAPLPKDQKVLVMGVLSGNLGDALESHPRVLWWSGDEATRKTGFPAGVGRVFVTKFLSHATFDKARRWEAQANAAYGRTARGLNVGEPGVHVVYQHGSTGQLKTAVYQSLGEHHPKWWPAESPAPAPMGAMAAALVEAARPLEVPTPPPAPPFASLEEYLTEFWDWQATESYAAQARAIWADAKEAGVTKASVESFATMAAKWARENRPPAPPLTGTLLVQARAAGATDKSNDPLPVRLGETVRVAMAPPPVGVRDGAAFTPAPIPDVFVPVRIGERRRPDSTASDAEALLALVNEALGKAQEVISALEMVKTSLPGLVAGLAEKEARVEAAIAALRGL